MEKRGRECVYKENERDAKQGKKIGYRNLAYTIQERTTNNRRKNKRRRESTVVLEEYPVLFHPLLHCA